MYWMENNFAPVADATGMNPVAKGWYERLGEEGSYTYKLSSDDSAVTGKTYYTGAKFIAWLSGHTHKDMMYYPTRFPNILNIVANLAGDQRDQYYLNRSDSPLAANLIFFDQYFHQIKMIRIGNSSNLYLRNTTYITYDYSERKILAEG